MINIADMLTEMKEINTRIAMLRHRLARCAQSCPFPRWSAYDTRNVWSKAYMVGEEETGNRWRLSAIIAFGV